MDGKDLLGCGAVMIVAAAVTVPVVPLARRTAFRLRLLDYPNRRKPHGMPVPVAGGLAIVVTLLAATLVTALLALRVHFGSAGGPLPWTVLSAAALFLVGALDDRFGLPASAKLVLQAACCIPAMAGGLVLTRVPLSGGEFLALGALAWPATLLWFLVVINAINLIDGLDGLAAGIAGLTAAALSGLAMRDGLFQLALPATVLLGSILGFLPFNLSRKRIFLGDGGSLLLGFLLAALAVQGAIWTSRPDGLIVSVSFLAIPLTDLAVTVFRRRRSGAPLFVADAWHIHHRLLWIGLGPRAAVLVLLGLTVCLGCHGLAMITATPVLPILVGDVFGLAAVLVLYRRWRVVRGAPDVRSLALLLLTAQRPSAAATRYGAPPAYPAVPPTVAARPSSPPGG